jgi:hypothetical protein
MSFLPVKSDGNWAFFDEKSAKNKGSEIANRYQNAEPFPHIVIDNFLPEELLNRVLADFPQDFMREQKRSQELFKGNYEPDNIPTGFTRSLFYSFNSRPFVSFLEALTGIDGLIPDPYFLGGGLHETIRGGRLGIHADFNLHKKLRLLRRINVLVYLNKNWPDEYKGALELWSKDMKEKVHSVAPLFNRCVVFSTNDNSYHGHPDSLECPEGVSRKSIALYYYTASEAIFSEEKIRTTVFKKRAQSADHFDYYIRFKYFIRDCIPPILVRAALRLIKGKQ